MTVKSCPRGYFRIRSASPPASRPWPASSCGQVAGYGAATCNNLLAVWPLEPSQRTVPSAYPGPGTAPKREDPATGGGRGGVYSVQPCYWFWASQVNVAVAFRPWAAFPVPDGRVVVKRNVRESGVEEGDQAASPLAQLVYVEP
jgi:hypothetical protein